MATLKINRADLFGPSKKVKIFLLTEPEIGELLRRGEARGAPGQTTGTNPESWKPAPTKVAEPETTSAGVLEVAIGSGAGELAAGAQGLAAAEVGGEWVYLRFRSPETAREAV